MLKRPCSQQQTRRKNKTRFHFKNKRTNKLIKKKTPFLPHAQKTSQILGELKFFLSNNNKNYNIDHMFLAHHEFSPGSSSSLSSLLVPALQTRHLQHTIQGAANKSSGDATSSRIPKPANIPITCVRCHITEALEWPSLFLQGPLS